MFLYNSNKTYQGTCIPQVSSNPCLIFRVNKVPKGPIEHHTDISVGAIVLNQWSWPFSTFARSIGSGEIW